MKHTPTKECQGALHHFITHKFIHLHGNKKVTLFSIYNKTSDKTPFKAKFNSYRPHFCIFHVYVSCFYGATLLNTDKVLSFHRKTLVFHTAHMTNILT